MQINLEINDGVIDKLLEKKGYVTKDILVHFPLVYSVSGYGSYYMKISYPMYNKPKCLDNEIVLVDDVKDYEYKIVVNKLISDLIAEKLLG